LPTMYYSTVLDLSCSRNCLHQTSNRNIVSPSKTFTLAVVFCLQRLCQRRCFCYI